jgi:hypothetical protein
MHGKVQRFKLKALTPELSIVENMVAAHCQALANSRGAGQDRDGFGGNDGHEKEGIFEYTGVYGCVGADRMKKWRNGGVMAWAPGREKACRVIV